MKKTGKKLRIDKILSHMGYGTRSEIKKAVKNGYVTVDGKTIKDSGMQVDPDRDIVEIDGEVVKYREYIYLMLHKPPGVISATEDLREETVIDLLDEEYVIFQPFPVGRLDKDTEGLLLLTNDGQLAHNLLSPRKHVPKTYEAKVLGRIGDKEITVFQQGVTLDDGYVTKPAELIVISEERTDMGIISNVQVTIHEGKFHQVKRMFEAVGSKVLYLKRISMGSLALDPELPMGSYRELTEEELNSLIN
ncbi:pseudouridine synthase [Paenibacillus provencensis]|uniref:Pseudouridine synthase n=1 Tax=Paenibacillus provencensis TaxID=441151 RepID=A0ABW3PNX8_9BACL|nr:pseudouridine synthase [Paenibacillus sp. MER 78]MCM3130248.1 rRNA pseudouridine synthase [Paenibacillus sp. MER 78]